MYQIEKYLIHPLFSVLYVTRGGGLTGVFLRRRFVVLCSSLPV